MVEKRIHGPKDLDPQHNQMWNGQCASDLYKTEEPKKEPSSPPRSCPPNHRDPPHAHVPSSVVQIGEVVHLLQAGVLGIRDHQASEATLLLRSSAQSLELLLEQDGGVHVGEDHGGVAAVVDPDALDVVLAHGLLAEAAEVGLLVHEEEPALDDGEPPAGVRWGAHELDDIVGRECIASGCLDGEGEAVGLAVNTLPADDLEEELGISGVLENHTSVSLALELIDTETDAVL